MPYLGTKDYGRPVFNNAMLDKASIQSQRSCDPDKGTDTA